TLFLCLKMSLEAWKSNISQKKSVIFSALYFCPRTYVESMREYISIHTSERRFVVQQTMNKMARELSTEKFIRVHRSFLINLLKIESINGNVINIGDKKIPVGASYRKQFFERVRLL
ncbi:MAG: LytTR family DNA-binding domain-containing protein, partial [Bacteroidota bacterium]